MSARPDFNEYNIQNALYRECIYKGHSIVVPNCNILQNESDVLSLSKSGYLNEFEIKISRSDFEADKKKRRHIRYLDVLNEDDPHYPERYCPKYFYYVVPHGLIGRSELPAYAGLIYVQWVCRGDEDNPKAWYQTLAFQRNAPLLHSNKATVNQITRMGRGNMFRYWEERKHEHYKSN